MCDFFFRLVYLFFNSLFLCLSVYFSVCLPIIFIFDLFIYINSCSFSIDFALLITLTSISFFRFHECTERSSVDICSCILTSPTRILPSRTYTQSKLIIQSVMMGTMLLIIKTSVALILVGKKMQSPNLYIGLLHYKPIYLPLFVSNIS